MIAPSGSNCACDPSRTSASIPTARRISIVRCRRNAARGWIAAPRWRSTTSDAIPWPPRSMAMDMPTRLPPAMRTGTSSSGMRCVSLPVSRVRVRRPPLLTSPAKRRDDVAVLAHRLRPVPPGLAAEAAVHRDAEAVEEPRRRRVPPPQAREPVDRQDDAEVDARVADVEVAQRREEALVLAAQVARAGHVHPVD